MVEEKKRSAIQNLILENRNHLTVSGVKDVDNFDDKTVVAFTDLGMLTVKGSDLHINRFNMESGELVLEGTIDQLEYSCLLYTSRCV